MSEDCHDSNNTPVNDGAPKRVGAGKERLSAEQINSLPEPVREWIHDLASNADPAGTLAELRLLQDAFKAQELLIAELRERMRKASEKIQKIPALDTESEGLRWWAVSLLSEQGEI